MTITSRRRKGFRTGRISRKAALRSGGAISVPVSIRGRSRQSTSAIRDTRYQHENESALRLPGIKHGDHHRSRGDAYVAADGKYRGAGALPVAAVEAGCLIALGMVGSDAQAADGDRDKHKPVNWGLRGNGDTHCRDERREGQYQLPIDAITHVPQHWLDCAGGKTVRRRYERHGEIGETEGAHKDREHGGQHTAIDICDHVPKTQRQEHGRIHSTLGLQRGTRFFRPYALIADSFSC